MESLVRFTLKQRVLFNLLFVVMIAAGAFTLTGLPMERYPEVNFGKVMVNLYYPGASPRDVEALVTREIEEALDGLEHVEFIRATSSRERASLVVKFRDGSDYERLYDELRFRVLSALDQLPPEVDPPAFDLIRTSFWIPVVSVNLLGERSNRALTLMAEELQVQLAAIPGVTEARLVGDRQREFHIFLDPDRLKAHGVSFDQVAGALADANTVLPAGDFTDSSGELLVRVDERFRTREQAVSTVVRRDADGSFVTVEDLISAARMGYRDPHVVTSVNGRDCVTVKLLKSEEGSALAIYRAAQAIVADAAPALATEGVEVALTQDSTVYIEESMGTLGSNLLVGVLLVSLIVWLFLGGRNAGIVTLGIPFSIMVTMILMELTGRSLNEITLFSFVLVTGIIVDDAIVVVENIYRRVQGGEPVESAIVTGTAEVAWPVIASTATTIAAFLPMLIMTGSTGEFFAMIPAAVSFALIASLFECLLILPLHYVDFGPRAHPGKPLEARDNLLLRGLRRMTDYLIRVTLRHRLFSIAAMWVAFVAAVAVLWVSVAGIAPLVRIKFFPDDYTTYYVFVEGPAGTPIEEIDRRVKAIAKSIMAEGPGYASSASGFAGFVVNEDYEQEDGHNRGTVMVAMPRKAERAFADPVDHLERMRERIVEGFAEPGFTIRVRAEKDGPPTGKDVNVQIVGTDEAAVRRLSERLRADLQTDPTLSPALIDLKDNSGVPERVLRLAVNAARTRELGLTQGEAARMAASVLDGRYIGKYRLADEEVDLKLRLSRAWLDTPEAALDLPVLEHPSGPVLLGDIVAPTPAIEPGELRRYQRQRSLAVSANLKPDSGVSSAQVTAWVRDWYNDRRADYPGATLVYGGEYATTQRSFESLAKAFGLAVLVIYLILAAQFRSYTQPLIVISAIMFAVVGVVFGKLVTQSLFTVNSFIAVVGVAGVVVNDSLVLIDFVNRRYRAGASRREAIIDGVHTRLRPIVLTTLTTVLGLLPMALGIPSYSLIWGTMASTFVTGLATATLLTLFIVPVAWDLLTDFEERRAAARERRRARTQGAAGGAPAAAEGAAPAGYERATTAPLPARKPVPAHKPGLDAPADGSPERDAPPPDPPRLLAGGRSQ